MHHVMWISVSDVIYHSAVARSKLLGGLSVPQEKKIGVFAGGL